MKKNRPLQPLDDRGPLRVMFVITCMPVGGAETLLVELLRRLDRRRFAPELCCLKYLGPMGEMMEEEEVLPVFSGLLKHKFDFRVLGRLTRLLQERRIDAVVTVGTGGDKMFWGRWAAIRAGVPVICSALHSTGLPDHVERLNRLLTPWTDAFIAVADPHALYLAMHEGCPARKVRVIPNGVDTSVFHPRWPKPALRESCGLTETDRPVIGIVAALRPEKRHDRFLAVAKKIHDAIPEAAFLIVGDGPERTRLEKLSAELGLDQAVRFLGTRSDVPELLALFDLFLLTSQMEANPVSIWEAMASECPVVSFNVGSIDQAIVDGQTGVLVRPEDVDQMAREAIQLLRNPERAGRMGRAGRERVLQYGSIDRMIDGYSDLLTDLYRSKTGVKKVKKETTLPVSQVK